MSSSEAPYRVVHHAVARKQLRDCLAALLAAEWDLSELTDIYTKAERGIEQSPSSFGEPHFQLRALDMTVAVVCARPFNIQIGIHEKSRTVFVRSVRLLTLHKP